MKFGLVFYAQNEAHWLNEHLPIIAPCVDMVIAVDGGSTDGTRQVIERHGGRVYDRPFDYDHAAQMNYALERADEHGVTHVLRLDCDEVMFPDDVHEIRYLLRHYGALLLPRMTFEADRQHYLADVYPDYQLRAHRVDIRWTGKVHETPLPDIRAKGQTVYTANHLRIYHYEGLHSPAYKAMKHVNYKRMLTGEPFITSWHGYAQHRQAEAYNGKHPVTTRKPRYPLPERDITPVTANGLRVWIRDDVDRAVVDQVFGEYAWSALPALNRVIDIGAHCGYFSAEVKRRNPSARISAVEVEPDNFDMLRFHLSHWSDVDLHHARAGYEAGEFVLAFNHLSNSSHRVIRPGAFVHDHFHDKPLSVPPVTLEDLTPNNEAVDVLKLDCEGAEVDILAHVSDAWLQRVNVIIGERHVTMDEFSAVDERLRQWFDAQHIPREGYEYLGYFTYTRRGA